MWTVFNAAIAKILVTSVLAVSGYATFKILVARKAYIEKKEVKKSLKNTDYSDCLKANRRIGGLEYCYKLNINKGDYK